MNHDLLPEMEMEAPDSPKRLHCLAVHNVLARWFEIAPGRVLNRMAVVGSNLSKPYQAQIIRRYGFATPETLVTNDPQLVREFMARHGRLIYKSISYIRSIVHTLEARDLARLDHIRWCPVQFQEYVDGTNVRVHVLDRQVFATAIHTSATDYRYAYVGGEEEELEPTEIPAETAERCIALTRALGLHFAGVDLKITPDGRVFCFEVNPCPAFGYYELRAGQPIAPAVARFLAGSD
jgi:glutathione synthase/RimK-type ligase-like ATP-grasp enzyme